MKIIRFPFIIILLSVALAASGQSKSTLREKKIVTQTVLEYFLDDGLDEPMVESIEKYNEDGDLVEVQEFKKGGDITTWEKFVYNDDRDVVEEVYLDAKGKVTRTEKNIYEDGLRIEKQFYNEKGKLYKKKEYKYEYRR